MPRPPNSGSLTERDWDRLEELADRFAAAWNQAGAVDLTTYLPPVGDPLRPTALQELIKTELEICWRRGLQCELEGYVQRFPELGSSSELPAALIYEELRVRRLHGDRPAVSTYRRRFPAQWPELERLLLAEPLTDTIKRSRIRARPKSATRTCLSL